MSLSGDEVVSQDTSHTSLINDEEAATYARAASRMTIPDRALTMMTKKIKQNIDKRIERLNKAWEEL